MFMLGMIAVVLGGFLVLVWWSYRSEAARARRGEPTGTPGALRWDSRISREQTE
jgi:hypothetical protein